MASHKITYLLPLIFHIPDNKKSSKSMPILRRLLLTLAYYLKQRMLPVFPDTPAAGLQVFTDDRFSLFSRSLTSGTA